MSNSTKPSNTSSKETNHTAGDPHVRQSVERKGRDHPPWWIFATILIVATVVLGLFGWSVGSAQLLLIETLLGICSLSVGGLLGFLFGIPRTLTPEGAEQRRSSTTVDIDNEPNDRGNGRGGADYQPSTNLEQVSDWLTKILIGVGLVQFTRIGEALGQIGDLVRTELSPAPPAVGILTEVVIVVYAVLGFFTGFLWTRIYYGAIQTLADTDVRWALSKLDQRLSQQDAQLSQQAETAEEVKEVTKMLATGALVRPSAVTSLDGKELNVQRRSGLEHEWPQELREKVQNFLEAETDWNSDPVDDLFGSAPFATNGRKLTVEIVANLSDALVLRLRVHRLGGAPMHGAVTFLLHPTFPERVITTPVQDDIAEINIYAAEWFTVAAIADEGRTILSYRLRTLPNAPVWFTQAD
jgi:hypothetical protein